MIVKKREIIIVIEDDPYFRDLWIAHYGTDNTRIFDYIETLFASDIDFSEVILIVLDYEIDQSNIVDLYYIQKLRNAGYKGPIAVSSMHSFEHLERDKQSELRQNVDFILEKEPISLNQAKKILAERMSSPYANF